MRVKGHMAMMVVLLLSAKVGFGVNPIDPRPDTPFVLPELTRYQEMERALDAMWVRIPITVVLGECFPSEVYVTVLVDGPQGQIDRLTVLASAGDTVEHAIPLSRNPPEQIYSVTILIHDAENGEPIGLPISGSAIEITPRSQAQTVTPECPPTAR